MRDPRVAISVIDAADGYRWVGLTAVVEEVVDDVERARDDIVALAHRYQPEGPTEPLDRRCSAASSGSPSSLRITGVHDHLED